jgi:lipopolysaccharide/colanic/teichoic acid biosynthesis glycosyltransferase
MRQTAHIYVIISSVILVAIAVMVFYNLSYPVVFYTVIFGQAFWLFTVYKVLTDKYSTEKTFDDWYEDNPMK